MNNSVFPIFRKSYITRGMDDRTAKLRAGWRRKGYKSCSRVDSSYGNKLFFPFQKPLPAAASLYQFYSELHRENRSFRTVIARADTGGKRTLFFRVRGTKLLT